MNHAVCGVNSDIIRITFCKGSVVSKELLIQLWVPKLVTTKTQRDFKMGKRKSCNLGLIKSNKTKREQEKKQKTSGKLCDIWEECSE